MTTTRKIPKREVLTPALIGALILALYSMYAVHTQAYAEGERSTSRLVSARDQRDATGAVHVQVEARSDYLAVVLTITNHELREFVFIPTLLAIEVKPFIPTWYPVDIRFCAMEIVLDSTAPQHEYLWHATSTLSITDQLIQMVRLPASTAVRIEYRARYDAHLKRAQIVGTKAYFGSFDVCVWDVNDGRCRDLVQRCRIDRSSDDRYIAGLQDGTWVIVDASSRGGRLSEAEARLLRGEGLAQGLLHIDTVYVDSVVHVMYEE